MPSVTDVIYADSSGRRLPLPVETWIQRGRAVLSAAGGPAIVRAVMASDHRLPDRDRDDDTASPRSSGKGPAAGAARPAER